MEKMSKFKLDLKYILMSLQNLILFKYAFILYKK